MLEAVGEPFLDNSSLDFRKFTLLAERPTVNQRLSFNSQELNECVYKYGRV